MPSATRRWASASFNNIAIAARWAQRERGVARVAIVDWDVHHGNGTEEIFLDDPAVLTVSLHQDGLYPEHTGGAGRGGERTSTSRCRRGPATPATRSRSTPSSRPSCGASRPT